MARDHLAESAFFDRLAAADQKELLGHVQVFLAEKRFEGCGGLEVTEEIRVTIATQACLLLLHRKTDYFPQLLTILVYPSGYVVDQERPVEGHIWEEGREGRLGETGRDDGLDGAGLGCREIRRARPIRRQESGTARVCASARFRGFRRRRSAQLAREEKLSWAEVMKMEFAALRAADETGISTLLDTYGATNAAEFFAVMTEAFFERPRALRRQHPRLYREMRAIFSPGPGALFERARKHFATIRRLAQSVVAPKAFGAVSADQGFRSPSDLRWGQGALQRASRRRHQAA